MTCRASTIISVDPLADWFVAIDGDRGLFRVPVEIEAVSLTRVLVKFLAPGYQHQKGDVAYVPRWSLCRFRDGDWISIEEQAPCHS